VTNVILQITDFIEPCGRNCKEHADIIQTDILEHHLNRGLHFVVIPVMGCSEYGHEKYKDDDSDNGGGEDDDCMIIIIIIPYFQ